MSGWIGFTDEDLKRLKKPSDEVSIKKSSLQKKSTSVRVSNQSYFMQKVPKDPHYEEITDQAKLSAPKKTDTPTPIPTPSKPNNRTEKTQMSNTKHQTNPNVTVKTSKVENRQQRKQPNEKIVDDKRVENVGDEKSSGDNELPQVIIDEVTIVEKGKENLEKFREQQKQIEEMNKKKRAMLCSAIYEKQKRTKAEAIKLSRIKVELDQLDQMVVADVSLIRDRIEEASRNYLAAQRRYEAAEKEFIESKVDLHNKCELKERLTEHLYSVIHQNERRKADKLQELLGKLEMQDDDVLGMLVSEEMPPPIPFLHPTPQMDQPNIQKFRHKVLMGMTSGNCDVTAAAATAATTTTATATTITATVANIDTTTTTPAITSTPVTENAAALNNATPTAATTTTTAINTTATAATTTTTAATTTTTAATTTATTTTPTSNTADTTNVTAGTTSSTVKATTATLGVTANNPASMNTSAGVSTGTSIKDAAASGCVTAGDNVDGRGGVPRGTQEFSTRSGGSGGGGGVVGRGGGGGGIHGDGNNEDNGGHTSCDIGVASHDVSNNNNNNINNNNPNINNNNNNNHHNITINNNNHNKNDNNNNNPTNTSTATTTRNSKEHSNNNPALIL